jgi:hypothetical protein
VNAPHQLRGDFRGDGTLISVNRPVKTAVSDGSEASYRSNLACIRIVTQWGTRLSRVLPADHVSVEMVRQLLQTVPRGLTALDQLRGAEEQRFLSRGPATSHRARS